MDCGEAKPSWRRSRAHTPAAIVFRYKTSQVVDTFERVREREGDPVLEGRPKHPDCIPFGDVPSIFKHRSDGRAEILTMDPRAFDKILENASNVESGDWRRLRAYAVVVFALATGMRAKEFRLCNVEDIDVSKEAWIAIVRHPKGENKYGRQRPVWVDPVAYPFLTRYLQAREDFLEANDLYTHALFPGAVDGGYLASNTLRTDKALVEDEINYPFDLRMCRRTYGQRLIDRGVGVNVVSKILGHSSTNTTERYYCTMDDMDAVRNVSEMLSGGYSPNDSAASSEPAQDGADGEPDESTGPAAESDSECPPVGGE